MKLGWHIPGGSAAARYKSVDNLASRRHLSAVRKRGGGTVLRAFASSRCSACRSPAPPWDTLELCCEEQHMNKMRSPLHGEGCRSDEGLPFVISHLNREGCQRR